MSRLQQALAALRDERAALQEELDWLDEQIAAFEARVESGSTTSQSAGSPRRRRASKRSGTSRRRTTSRSGAADLSAEPSSATPPPTDMKQRIVRFLEEHPQSTAGDVAKGIAENRTTVATRLVELARTGEIVKAPRGYSAG